MSSKSILRFLIGFVIAVCLMSFIVPLAGIPRAQMFPPPFVYSNAKGKATGYITKVYDVASADPFGVSVGKRDYLVDYQFRAPAWVGLNAPKGEGKNTLYKGRVGIRQDDYEKAKQRVNTQVPVKFDPTYPPINGIDLPGFGRSHINGASISSGWIIWFMVALLIGFMIAPLLQRIFLREDY
jgi:hypothetical protein